MYVREMVNSLAQRAVARVTLYTPEGQVVETTLGGGQEGMSDILVESPEQYETILALLREAPERHPVVISKAEEEIYLRQHEVLGQEYILAFGDWRVRGQSLGFFSVALPSNFIFNTALTSRNMLSLVFSLATIAVFGLGFIIARRIVQPLHRLVETSIAVARGDLTQRTGIERADEIGSLAHSFDIMTDRLENRNRQLVEQASKLEAILNSTADGIIVIDRQGSIITINPAAQKILFNVSSNFLPNLLKDLPSTFFLDSEDDENANQALELARLQQPRRYQVDNYFLSSLVAPVRTPSGEELGIVIALRDITREAEAEQLKDSFITNISHELRTPLTAIKGYSDLLLMTPNDDFNENQLKFMQSINENAGTMIHHINELIDISQVQSGLLKLEEDNVNLPELVEEVAEHWREKIESKGLSLEVKLPEEELWVYGDFKRLTWVVDNLLSNAYSYTLQDGRVEVRLFRAGDEVRLDVTDTGVGVAVVDQPYLFTRFFRANNQLTFDVEGVGLGLFIVRSVVELHGGRVWAESEVGSGSTFSLALPLLETEAVENG
jgi:signal transduction histidine kinase